MRENLKDARQTKVQTGLRIPERRYKELSEIADSAGLSVNALALLLIDVGLSAIRLGTQEEYRALLLALRGTSE